ncbi:MAG: hypothetical protein PHV77_07390 [Candidatus Omnitrophica bacterium]|nr:hypothetical protein [Candidatus Omnitrophota bacterium]
MVHITGTQVIPSEWEKDYKGTLTKVMPNGAVRKRYPWRLPGFQKFGLKVTGAQKIQRGRLETVASAFNNLSDADRARWYSAMPQWNSLLWYYNYFIMSGLSGDVVINDKGAGVIKNIRHYTFTLPNAATPRATVGITAVDPQKSVPFFFGAGIYEPASEIFVAIYPYLVSLATTQMVIGASMPLSQAADLSVTLIEYV